MGTIYRQGQIVHLYLKKIVNFSSNLSGSKSKFSNHAPPQTSKSYFDQVGFFFSLKIFVMIFSSSGLISNRDNGNKSFDYF